MPLAEVTKTTKVHKANYLQQLGKQKIHPKRDGFIRISRKEMFSGVRSPMSDFRCLMCNITDRRDESLRPESEVYPVSLFLSLYSTGLDFLLTVKSAERREKNW